MNKRTTSRLWIAGIAILVAMPSAGREVWVVRFQTPFPDVVPPCQPLQRWFSHLMFTNTTSQEQTVRVLAASNGGGVRPDAQLLRLVPGRTVSLQEAFQLNWGPADRSTAGFLMWVNKLDLPEGVKLAVRGETGLFEPDSPDPNPPCRGAGRTSAGVPLPVVQRLVPAGEQQYLLGVDLGDYTNVPRNVDSRINVGVFNAGSAPAVARIQVRCSQVSQSLLMGTDPVLTEVMVTIPPDTLQQQTILPSTRAVPCTLAGSANPYHVSVTSDQPGFSYAVGLLNGPFIEVPGLGSPAGGLRFPTNISVTH